MAEKTAVQKEKPQANVQAEKKQQKPSISKAQAENAQAVKAQAEKRRIVLVRVRGCTGICDEVEDTMRMLCLTRANHCSIIDSSPQYSGMVNKCKDYITWGEASVQTLAKLFEKRGLKSGDKKVAAEELKQKGFSSFADFAEKFSKFQCSLEDVGLKKVFRLNPPSKGFKGGLKQAFPSGALGPRGKAIDDLLRRMM